jgi:iron complex outermembrane receptor protein
LIEPAFRRLALGTFEGDYVGNCTKRLLGGVFGVAAVVSPVLAQETVPTGGVASLESVIVYGQGESRQIQEIKAADIAILTPGTSPLKAIEKLPNVNFQSADAYGAYEWSSRISIRGFNQNQLGFTLDEVPLGDMSYGNHNGLHISRAISSENIGLIKVSQGSGSLGTASSSNLGGTLQFYSRDPSAEFGGKVAMTAGSDGTLRPFARIDSGELATGTRMYLSYTFQDADKWKGEGVQRQNQFNFKFVQPIGNATLTGFVNYSDRRENDYQDLSLEMIDRLGYKWDNFRPDWDTAVEVAQIYQSGGSNFPNPILTVDDAYYDASGLRKDLLSGLTLEAPITEGLGVKLTGYYHRNRGQGLWYTPYVPTPGGGPISIRTTEYAIDRGGVIGAVNWEIGGHEINGGFWWETNDFNQARRFYGIGFDQPAASRSIHFQRDAFFTQWEFDFHTETLQFHLQDTWQVTDSFAINAGFKSLRVSNEATPVVNTSFPTGKIKAEKNFLPQAGAVFEFAEGQELFASFTRNMRAFVSSVTSGPFSTTQAGFNAIAGDLKPETSNTYEIGYRFQGSRFQGVLAAYYVDFQDRLLGITVGSGIQGNPSVLQNVGDVTSYGFEAAGTLTIVDDVSLFGSYAYNDSSYDDDVVSGNGNVTLTKGKTVVDSPKHLFKAELVYDDDALFAKIGMSYMSKRFYTYLNDGRVPDRALVELSVGYRFSGNPWIEGLVVQANVNNLTNKKYASTIGSNGFVNSDPTGLFATLLAGSPRQFFVTVSKEF